MDANLQRRIQRYGWDAAARHYDAAWRDNLAPAHEAMLSLAALRPGERVLDLACGSGLLAFRAARIVGLQGAVTATDLSGEMVDQVRRGAEQAGLSQVETRRMDAEVLSLPDGSFDAVLCGLGLMYVPDPDRAAREMWRVLRHGGRAVAAVWGERRNCGWAELFPIVDSEVRSEVCPLFFALGSGESLRASLEQAGFASVEVHRLQGVVEYAGEADVLTAMLDGGAMALAAKRFNAATRQRVADRFLQSIAAYRHANGGYGIPSEFVVASGWKRQGL
jgi:ubiquinone/menaquinone biosynthesis C-methylase UbiE